MMGHILEDTILHSGLLEVDTHMVLNDAVNSEGQNWRSCSGRGFMSSIFCSFLLAEPLRGRNSCPRSSTTDQRFNSVVRGLQATRRGNVSVWQIMFWERLEIKWIVWGGDVVRRSQYLDYVTPNGRMIHQWWIGKDLKGSDRRLNRDTVLEFALERTS
jgi:hypothetical protein